MYESFYNLHLTPFRLTPDPHFFYESGTHKRGLAYLRFAFHQREGFVVITGAPGSGKTELMLNVINEFPRHKVTLAKIVTSNLDADDLLHLVAASFQINPQHLSKGLLLKKLEDYFYHQAYNGKHVLLLIDEAHNLSIKSLIELSMLSNFQISEKPIVQCFLLGQDPLEEKLSTPELAHLKQRVLASTRLESLNQAETREYITHRLLKSGWKNNPIIRDTAFALIYYYSHGVPRKINSLCNRILLQSFLEDRHDIGADLVHQVIEEMQDELLAHDSNFDLAFVESQMQLDRRLIPQVNTDSAERDSTSTGSISLNKPTDKRATLPPQHEQFVQEPVNNEKPSTHLSNIPEFIKSKADFSLETTSLQNEVPAEVSGNESAPVWNGNKRPLRSNEEHNPAGGNETKDPLLHAAANKPVHPPNNRQSGLIDKELQALASLCDTHAYPQSPHEQQTTLEKSQELPPCTIPVKKVIIDDLARDNYKRVEENTAFYRAEIKSLRKEHDQRWRPVATVAAILAGIALSVYWAYDGETTLSSDTASSQPAYITAEIAVIDLPLVDAAATTHETTTGAEYKAELTATPAVESIAVAASKEPELAASVGNGSAGTTQLKVHNTRSQSPTGLTSTVEIVTPKTQSARRENPKGKSASSEQASAPLRAPTTGIPLALEESLAPDSASANPKTLPAYTTDTSRLTIGSEPAVTDTREDTFISGTDLNTLLSTLANAYENGNLQQLVSTFAEDIYSSDGTGRHQMENDFRRLFNITDTRQLNIHDISWSQRDRQMLGKGDFQVRVREKGANKYTTYEGTIRLAVVKESNTIVIKQLDYDYNN